MLPYAQRTTLSSPVASRTLCSVQSNLIDDLDRGVDQTKAALISQQGRLKKLLRKSRDNWLFCTISTWPINVLGGGCRMLTVLGFSACAQSSWWSSSPVSSTSSSRQVDPLKGYLRAMRPHAIKAQNVRVALTGSILLSARLCMLLNFCVRIRRDWYEQRHK